MRAMSWLDDYIGYHSGLTDAPREFAEVLGLTLLGQAVGRNSIHPLKPFPIRHNVYTILLGEPGRSRKSTSLGIAGRMSPSYVYPAEFSPEALVDELKNNPRGLLIMDEVSGFLKKSFDRRSYMSGTIELLNRVYDCPDILERRTKSSGLVQGRAIFVSLVAATTSENFKSSIEPEAFDGGFLARCVIVEPQKSKARPRGYLDGEVEQGQKELVGSIKKLYDAYARKQIQFKFEGDAFELYQRLCKNMDRKYRKQVGGGFLSRYEDYLVKFADLYQVSEEMQSSPNSQGSIIHVTSNNLRRSYELIDDRLKDIVRICEFCESAKPVLKVKAVLERQGPCERGKILRYGHMMSDELDRALRTLKESGEAVDEGGQWKLKRQRGKWRIE